MQRVSWCCDRGEVVSVAENACRSKTKRKLLMVFVYVMYM